MNSSSGDSGVFRRAVSGGRFMAAAIWTAVAFPFVALYCVGLEIFGSKKMMNTWKVVAKRQDSDRGDVVLVLVVERNGQKRDAVVSGPTWLAKGVGDDVELTL